MADESTPRAPDKRTLAYSETGSRDGAPVFYFHFSPDRATTSQRRPGAIRAA